jgi:hypothetical protein
MPKARVHGWKAGPGGVWCVYDRNSPHYCNNFSFLIGEREDVQPIELREASVRINDILRDLRDAPEGRSLVLLGTSLADEEGGHGLLLAYAQTDEAPPTADVTYDSDEGKIRKALGVPEKGKHRPMQ